MSKPPRTGSAAKQVKPAQDRMTEAAAKSRAAFNKASNPEREKRRESFMVKRQQPKPALRPAPHIANGPDRAAFNQQWQQEQKAAAPKTKQDRKAAFMAARKATTPTRNRTRNK